jgi:DNA helicase HerA-like ATPase
MRTEVTFLGLVQRVVGAKVYVEISQDIPSASPIINGRLYRLGQVGSFIRIPLGFINLYGIVAMVGASPNVESGEMDISLPAGQRWLEIQLLGESQGREGFKRGVSIFPTLDDEAHIVTEDDLAIIYGTSGPSMVEIGTHAASESLPAMIDLDKIVTRHAAVLGSTGSGKSNTIAGILKALTSGSFPSARVVVIDPHGEYSSALEQVAKIWSIGNLSNSLIVPYWALSFDELAWFLVDRRTASESLQDTSLRDYIFDKKREHCSGLKAGAITPDEVTVDSPIPFSIKDLWYHFDRKERVTYNEMARTTEALEKDGNAETLVSARFRPAGAGSSAPFKPTTSLGMASYTSKILARLKDTRFDFLLNPGSYNGSVKDLSDLVAEWIDHDKAITVFDLGGIPFDITDLVVGVVTRILFEAMFWGRELPGIGRQRPLLFVYEEAHGYLPRGGSAQFVVGYGGRAVRRIFKEGRKYGVGAIVVSQRPSELDETILSQCGTFFALRLSNSDDQGRIKSTIPDALAGLMDLLPALRTGEALIVGEGVQIPSRVRLPLVEPRPRSNDPEISKEWKKDRIRNPSYDKAVTAWRRQRSIAGNQER